MNQTDKQYQQRFPNRKPNEAQDGAPLFFRFNYTTFFFPMKEENEKETIQTVDVTMTSSS